MSELAQLSEAELRELTNRKLGEEVERLSEALGLDAPSTDRLGKQALIELVMQLRGKLNPSEVRLVEDEVTPPAGTELPATEAPPPVTAPSRAAKVGDTYRVADGRSVTSRRGILGEGTAVKPTFFVGGDETIARLVRAGILVRA